MKNENSKNKIMEILVFVKDFIQILESGSPSHNLTFS